MNDTGSAAEPSGPDDTPDPDGRRRAQDAVVAFWDLRSATYDDSPGHAVHSEAEHRAWLAALGGLLPPPPADVLDAGTGTGFLALLLAELGHRVTGVDLAPGMLAAAREKAAGLPPGPARPRFETGDAVDPPLPPGSVDAVVCRHLLWTLTDPARAFVNWHRLLRPGGRVVAIDGLWSRGRGSPAGPRDPAAPDSQSPSPPASDQPAAGGAVGAAGTASPGAAAGEAWREARERYYTEAVRAALPLYEVRTLDPVVAAAAAAGFRDVRVAGLEEVDRTENAAHPDRPPRNPRYVLTGDRA
jgi:SAM-dependent methyltransferase